jgi:SulP family sulfate permease
MVHAVFVLLALVVLAPMLGHVPMASLAGLLIFVAWRMGEFGHLVSLLIDSPKSDKIVLVSCFLLTVLIDMVYGVFGGVVIAAVLFAQDMSQSAGSETGRRRVVASAMTLHTGRIVAVFELNGPLFFGSAADILRCLEFSNLPENCEGVVVEMDNVSMCDISGASALAGVLEKLLKRNIFVYIVGIRNHPLELLRRLMLKSYHLENLRIIDSLHTLQRAMEIVADFPTTPHLQPSVSRCNPLLVDDVKI